MQNTQPQNIKVNTQWTEQSRGENEDLCVPSFDAFDPLVQAQAVHCILRALRAERSIWAKVCLEVINLQMSGHEQRSVDKSVFSFCLFLFCVCVSHTGSTSCTMHHGNLENTS